MRSGKGRRDSDFFYVWFLDEERDEWSLVVVVEGPYLDCHLSRKLDGYEVRLGTIGAERKRTAVRF